MSLSSRQAKFTLMVAHLIQHAHMLGYRLTFGDAYRDPRVHGKYGEKKSYSARKSQHKRRLAVDFNLFIKDKNGKWRYRTSTEAHRPLGEFWESLGGVWGGRFSRPDGNHYQAPNT